jgi:tungstate transport system ATP-binding protein
MTSTLVKLTSIKKWYGRSIALELSELIIYAGRLHLLTGPNGSGKSTLLGILALLTRPNQGEIFFAGELVNWKKDTVTRIRRRVTLLHQSPYLFHGTVFDNVAFGLSVRGTRGFEARQIVSDTLAMVGLSDFGERNIGQLSGGEAQRVAMARALAIRPELLLLDEPLANVDTESARVLEEVISSLPGKGTTVVMSSHDPHQHERLACEVLGLLGGRMVNNQSSRHTIPLRDKEISLCPPLTMHEA